ncbi:MAG: acetylglutamate kinase [Spirochaeta sp. LUC14_002_19_P3]|nr:MAG: acetylglutamate kinase [Spirochaeta sp. LUC14_002_19_P3]
MTLIKLGGIMAEDSRLIIALADEVKTIMDSDEHVLIVHGGGIVISELQQCWGITPRFKEGLRQTSPREMPLIDMALAGAVNKRLVRLFYSRGLAAWGLCGADAGVLTGTSIAPGEADNRTGTVCSVNTDPIRLLIRGAYLPIFAPPSMNKQGEALNINADEAAFSLASSLTANRLIFLSDVPGIIRNNVVLPELAPDGCNELIKEKIVTDGMVPKLQAAVNSLHAGVSAVHIASYTEAGSLKRILSGETGTAIRKMIPKGTSKKVIC